MCTRKKASCDFLMWFSSTESGLLLRSREKVDGEDGKERARVELHHLEEAVELPTDHTDDVYHYKDDEQNCPSPRLEEPTSST
jgi:hypothetical protein